MVWWTVLTLSMLSEFFISDLIKENKLNQIY
jgi:hypothetical protein